MTLKQSKPYDCAYFQRQETASYLSAKSILPLVRDIVSPRSIVDVGCGVGTWLRAWKELGAQSILGIDGDYVSANKLQIPATNFMSMDLSRPQKIDHEYDLAESMEVGEHLPKQAAQNFVTFLCSLAPVVLFSAAVPQQGGTHHVNEQWPAYWARKFGANGYEVFDVIRPKVWTNEQVEPWYAQNALLFVRRDNVNKYANLLNEAKSYRKLAMVHPRCGGKRMKLSRFLHRTLSI
jgi:hypothetical protein